MKNCICLRAVCTILIVVALGASIWCVWSCKAEVSVAAVRLPKKNGFILGYDDGIAVFRNNKESYTVFHYDSLDKAFLNAKDNDIIYVFDSEIRISEQEIGILCSKLNELKNISISFVKVSSVNSVKIK